MIGVDGFEIAGGAWQVRDVAHLTTRNWEALKAKVRDGATLYISWDETFLPAIEEVCGIELDYRETISEKLDLAFDLGESLLRPWWQSITVPNYALFVRMRSRVLCTVIDVGRGARRTW